MEDIIGCSSASVENCLFPAVQTLPMEKSKAVVALAGRRQAREPAKEIINMEKPKQGYMLFGEE